MSIIPLRCSVKQYSWGNVGSSSFVSQLALGGEHVDSVDPSTPYAEAHPDEALAKQLHERSPDNYPDDQPKPEMAVAINSRFEALVGFVDISELISYVQNVPPFLENVVELEIYNQILHLGSMEPGRQKEKLVADVFRILVSKIMRLEQKRADDALDAID
ncbi:unnamed protein product, partial [Sphagnum compactum]